MIYDGLWHLVYHRKSMIYFGLFGFTIFAYTMIKSYDNHVTIEFIRTLLLSLFFLNGLVQGNIFTGNQFQFSYQSIDYSILSIFGNLWDSSEFALTIYYILQPLEKTHHFTYLVHPYYYTMVIYQYY